MPEFGDKEFAAKYAKLWQTMTPENEIEKATLEVYTPGNPQSSDYECGIWIPVQKMG